MSETVECSGDRIYRLVRVAAATGHVGRGLLECSTSVQKRDTKLLVIAEDIEPKELTNWLRRACIEKNVPYVVVPSKRELGSCAGIPVSATSVTIDDPGEAADDLTWVLGALAAIHRGIRRSMDSSVCASEKGELLSALASAREEIGRLEHYLSAHPQMPDRASIKSFLDKLLTCVAVVATRGKVDLQELQSEEELFES